jgi:predicted XRE-type DNA-binding protein
MIEEEPRFERGSDNIFADLDLPNPDELLAKAKVLIELRLVIERRKLSQRKLAAIIGVDQAIISNVIRGKIEGFSLDRLIEFLNKLGQDVEIVIRDSPPRGNALGVTTVRSSRAT